MSAYRKASGASTREERMQSIEGAARALRWKMETSGTSYDDIVLLGAELALLWHEELTELRREILSRLGGP